MIGYVSKKKHDLHICVLKARIRELESIVCPDGKHEFEVMSTAIEPGCIPSEVIYVHTLQCKRCRKIVSQRSLEV